MLDARRHLVQRLRRDSGVEGRVAAVALGDALGAPGGLGRGRLDHDLRPLLSLVDQFRNERRLRQVPPVFPGHVLGHHLGVQPSGIENRGVVGAPIVLQGVLGREAPWDLSAPAEVVSASPSQCTATSGVRSRSAGWPCARRTAGRRPR